MTKNIFLLLAITTLSILLAHTTIEALVTDRNYSSFLLTRGVPKAIKIPAHIHTLFTKFKTKYGLRTKNPSDDLFRLKNFYENFKEVEILKKKYSETKFGITKFSFFTKEELSKETPIIHDDEDPKNSNDSEFESSDPEDLHKILETKTGKLHIKLTEAQAKMLNGLKSLKHPKMPKNLKASKNAPRKPKEHALPNTIDYTDQVGQVTD